MFRMMGLILSAIIILYTLNGCNSESDSIVQNNDETSELSGGEGTVADESVNAFSFPSRTLPTESRTEFFIGNSLFNQNWVEAPASTSLRDGVGPFFNSRSCSGCHFKDGRGKPPELGEEMLSMLLRLSIPGVNADGSPLGEPNYGGQLQNFAISGTTPEGKPMITYSVVQGTFADGEKYYLQKPEYTVGSLAYGALHSSVLVSPRVAPHMIGLGLLEAISDDDIIRNADEFDNNSDGISGKVNRVFDYEKKQTSIGRFGWKANQPTLRQQVAGALNGDMGITSSIFPILDLGTEQKHIAELPNGGNPEIEAKEFNEMVLYSSVLAVPVFRPQKNVIKGKELFRTIGCISCHRAEYRTAQHPTIPVLSNQKISPYTDLLLHDMGDDLTDNRPDFLASGNEWRTPPLWGIGLFKVVNGHTRYLHDGRAHSLEEAILWHGGEANSSREMFKKLDKSDRRELIRFLETL